MTVIDDTPPEKPVLANVAGQCTVTPTAPTTTDNCSGIITGTTTTVFPITTTGVSTVVWTFIDAAGNSTTANQIVTINDTQSPTWVTKPPATVNLECDADTTIAGTGGAPVPTDNCAFDRITRKDSIVGLLNNCSVNYTLYRKWTAYDQSGNYTKYTQTIHVQDNTPPEINCTSYTNFDIKNLPAVDDFGGITVSDNCTSTDDIFIFAVSEDYQFDNNLPGFCPTGLTRVYRAVDLCGNSSECTQTYTFIDDPDCDLCPGGVISFQHIFESADESWDINDVRRDGNCCSQSGNPPLRCAAYNFYLHKDAVGVIFQQDGGALPPF